MRIFDKIPNYALTSLQWHTEPCRVCSLMLGVVYNNIGEGSKK